jgi:hypothetical protein
MEQDRKIRVAITHGDTNGVGYELIFKIFEDPAMLELCTPIIYGSPKVAAYHRKTLNKETPFSIIASAAGVALFFILTHFPIKIGSGKKISIADRLFNIIDTMNKGYFIMITAAVFVLICALYYIVMWRSYERREA